MDPEKKYFTCWWFWVLLLVIITTIILSVLSYFGMIGQTIVERKVFEQSYQKKEADKDALATYDAQISILRRRLRSQDITEDQRAEIQAQIDALNILKSTKGN